MNHNDDFRIVLLHEDRVSGIRGSAVLERLAGQLETEVGQLDTDIWKFAVLCEPALSARALDHLRRANMIIISVGGQVELPGHIRDIIEQALYFRVSPAAAMVALLDHEPGPGSHIELPRAGLYLQNLAARTGLDFFCNEGPWRQQAENVNGLAAMDAAAPFFQSNPVVPWNS